MSSRQPGAEQEPIGTASRSFLDRPLVRGFRDRLSLRNIKEKIFGGNALPGHFVSFLAGASTGVIDYGFDLQSEATILTFAPVAVLVPSLLIPYQGYDRQEQKQANIITFGPMFTIGTTAGGLISSVALDAKNPTPSRLAMAESALNCVKAAADKVGELSCLEPLITEASASFFTASNSTGLAAAGGVLMAYITVGFMSRDERWKYLSPLGIAESVKRVSSGLLERTEHKLADALHRGILRGNQKGLQHAIHVLDDLKATAVEEPEMTLDELRADTASKLAENPNYFEKRDEHLSRDILEQAQRDLVAYHYGRTESPAPQPRRIRGNRRFLRRG